MNKYMAVALRLSFREARLHKGIKIWKMYKILYSAQREQVAVAVTK